MVKRRVSAPGRVQPEVVVFSHRFSDSRVGYLRPGNADKTATAPWKSDPSGPRSQHHHASAFRPSGATGAEALTFQSTATRRL
jgi:hypothetical protein